MMSISRLSLDIKRHHASTINSLQYFDVRDVMYDVREESKCCLIALVALTQQTYQLEEGKKNMNIVLSYTMQHDIVDNNGLIAHYMYLVLTVLNSYFKKKLHRTTA